MYHIFLLVIYIFGLSVGGNRFWLFLARRFFLFYLWAFRVIGTFGFWFGVIWIFRLRFKFLDRWYSSLIKCFAQLSIFLNLIYVLMFEIKYLCATKFIFLILLIQFLQDILFIVIKFGLHVILVMDPIFILLFLQSFHF